MPFKYIFIGLPGSGKTTVLKAISKTLPDIRLFLMDDEIKIRLNRLVANPQAIEQLKKCETDDAVVNSFCAKWCKSFDQEIVINALLRKGFEKHSVAIMKLLGEPQWREFEAAIAADFLKREKECAFDLGGSQPLNAGVKQACNEVGIKFIYLKADHETICSNLSKIQADGRPRWQHISNYQAAGSEGWQALAHNHRKEREGKLEAISDVTVDVSHLSVEQVLLEVRGAIAKYELGKHKDNNEEIERMPSPLLHRNNEQGDKHEEQLKQGFQPQGQQYSPKKF